MRHVQFVKQINMKDVVYMTATAWDDIPPLMQDPVTNFYTLVTQVNLLHRQKKVIQPLLRSNVKNLPISSVLVFKMKRSVAG